MDFWYEEVLLRGVWGVVVVAKEQKQNSIVVRRGKASNKPVGFPAFLGLAFFEHSMFTFAG